MSSPSQKPDPHVVALNYNIEHDSTITYDSPEAVTFENRTASFLLKSGCLRCELKEHFSHPSKAREVIEPTLRAWELNADLQYGKNALLFKYSQPEVIDRSPKPLGAIRSKVLFCEAGEYLLTGCNATLHITRKHYPKPPEAFTLNPDVETLALRFQGYRDGHEPLLSMAYFCLTVIEGLHNGRKKTASALNIDLVVLNKIGELTTKRGSKQTARKASGAKQPLLGKEATWLEAVVKELILLVGDTRQPSRRPPLTMQQLPPL